MVRVYIPWYHRTVYDQPNFVPFIVETEGYINGGSTSSWTPYGAQGSGPAADSRTRALQATVTPRRRAQGGVAGPGPYPSLHARRQWVTIPAVDLAVEAGGVRESVPVSNHKVVT
jgi:hypothetical protein